MLRSIPLLIALGSAAGGGASTAGCRVLSGPIEGCCGCTSEAVTAVNNHKVLPLLHRLAGTTYFRYYKASLGTDSCPFAFNEGVCGREECAVEHCCSSDLPECLQGQTKSSSIESARGGPVWDESTGEGGGASGGAEFAEPSVWTEAGGAEDEYYDLGVSYEAFTGYGLGDDVDRNETRVIWELLYQQPCFSDSGSGGGNGAPGGQCLEERVFYRLLSGLHASINTHLSLTSAKGPPPPAAAAAAATDGNAPPPHMLSLHYKPNLDMYIARVGNSTERMSNLYFAYIFVARAVTRAGSILRALAPATGSAAEDAEVHALLAQLLEHTASPEGGLSEGFDESKLFVGSEGSGGAAAAAAVGADASAAVEAAQAECPPASSSAGSSSSSSGSGGLLDLKALEARHLTTAAALPAAPSLLARYRERYRNISRILDCVGCPRCQLWGKLQFLGLGTAMKILFAGAEARERGGSLEPATVHLSRNEAVALINVFHRLSISVAAVGVMQQLEAAASDCSSSGVGEAAAAAAPRAEGSAIEAAGSATAAAAAAADTAAVAAVVAAAAADTAADAVAVADAAQPVDSDEARDAHALWQRAVGWALGSTLLRALAVALCVCAATYCLFFQRRGGALASRK